MRMTTLFACFVFSALFSFHASANCYKAASKECKPLRKQAVAGCKDVWRKGRAACRVPKKQSYVTCRKTYNTTKKSCKVIVVKGGEKKECKTLETTEIAACKSMPGATGSCDSGFKACRVKCFRSCKVCTQKAVSGCVATCLKKKDKCMDGGKLKTRKCIRAARQKGRDCRRAFRIELWKKYYLCLSSTAVKRFKCQWMALDVRTHCYNRHYDNYLACYKTAKLGYKKCWNQSFERCKTKPKKR